MNSFGYGGANAHVIIDATDSYLDKRALLHPRSWVFASSNQLRGKGHQKQILVASARSLKSLEGNIAHISQVMPKYALFDLAYTLFERRTHFAHRA